MRRGVSTLFACTAVLLCLPATASAEIVPRRSIAGIMLGMTPEQVQAELGQPSSKFRKVWGARALAYPAWRYRTRRLVIVFVGGKTQFVETRSPQERTAKGIGPGANHAALIRAYPAARCIRVRVGGICLLGNNTGVQPTPYTGFWLHNDLVRSVEVSVATP